MAIKDYSATPSSNTSLFPEGMDPAAVNNGMRQVQADVRSFYEDPEWRDYGSTPTYVSSTSFTISGNVTARYSVGSRIRMYGSTMGTFYGTIATSAYSAPNTTITVTMDSGALTSNLSAVALGFKSTGSPIPGSSISGSFNGSIAIAGTSTAAASISLAEDTDNGTNKVTIIAPATLAADYTLTLPSNDGDSGQYLQTNGSGTTSWATITTATDAVAGVVEKATQAEVEAETADKYPDAALLKYHPGIAKAWVNFNGTGTVAIRASYNVSSITDNGTGNYTVNLTTAMSSSNYCVVCNHSVSASNPDPGWASKPFGLATGSFSIKTGADSSGATSLADAALITATVYGDQ